jgi:diphthamide synthase (EF-2-diphthine--ammonia ligase)
VLELIDAGYVANITIVNTKVLAPEFLGKVLTRELINEIKQHGIDPCGENGEYHTFVSDGAIFKKPISIKFDTQVVENGYAILPIVGRG